ncbi:UvrB/UvrC motif-containing protein [Bacillus sp. B15-48]|uniref:UvrB/UvrC motif-containing protein n=1 Tax=Bacillus sp. B15-48 TaxID=1548601 RepID=UPI00193F1C87|nr:UvrB/UvrC motif-containing protein [Bacillus sp. B15-48]
MDLKEKAKKLPLSPGVYFMKDAYENIIYVGKAKKLRNRVQSYFQESKHHSPKVKKLVKQIKDFTVIHTDTEFEAFLLECQSIKDIQPFYNSRMKRPQTYPYIVIDYVNGLRQVDISTNPHLYKNTNALVFGPYSSKTILETAISAIKECYQINCCNLGKRNSPCLNYSLGTCNGVCFLGEATLEYYESVINKLISFLSEKDDSIVKDMEQKMNLAAERNDFEKAAKFRNYVSALHVLTHRKKVLTFTKKPKNIAVIEVLDDDHLKFFLLKGNNILFKEKYDLKLLSHNELKSQLQRNILAYFKKETNKVSLIQQEEIDEAQIIYSYLKDSQTTYIAIPQTWIKNENIEKLNHALDQLLKRYENAPLRVIINDIEVPDHIT